MHRVTFVSRVLSPPDAKSPLEERMQQLDLRSNYELVRALDPYVRDATGDLDTFALAVRTAVAQHLPQLSDHLASVLPFLLAYYGVGGLRDVVASEDLSRVATPADIAVAAPLTAAVGAPLPVSTRLLEGRPASAKLTWSRLSGPVAFAKATSAATTATFPVAGDYVVRAMTAQPAAWEEIAVSVR